MIPIKKILCPTDFSEPSYVGFQSAHELAMHFSAELILVHVVPHIYFYPPHGSGMSLDTYLEEVINASRNSLEELVENRVSPDLQVETIVLQGNPADQIVEVAGSKGVDLIVTATHGWTGWRRFMFGSVAERVLRTAGCPVMTVPAPREGGEEEE